MMRYIRFSGMAFLSLLAAVVVFAEAAPTFAQTAASEFPAYNDVIKGYEKVISTADGQESLYTIWTRKKDGQMLAELPSNFASQKYFIALTVASGDRFAGLQAGDMYVYWRRYDKRLALIEPNIEVRSSGDDESKASVKRLFTDRLVLDVPILTLSPKGGPVIDMDQLLVGKAAQFFGGRVHPTNPSLAAIAQAKAFPQNVELAFEFPSNGGQLQTVHYSISSIPTNSSYKPRVADERVGYFTTAYSDLGKYKDDETRVRYINRWNLEKADPKLKVSPPKEPIVFYIEHTTPVRYRRWVREGILYWNSAFEKVGLSNAIEVYYQDADSKAHMDKDPEDVRHNFVRWLNNDIGTAIGPSRVNPMTGQILDADIILTDGWIRHYWHQFNEVMPSIAMQGMSAETLAWLARHPSWDPRIRLAPPSERASILERIAIQARQPFSGDPMSRVDSKMIGDDSYDGLIGRTSQVNGLCLASQGKAFDIGLMRMSMDIFAAEAETKEGEKKDEKKDEKKEEESLIDGVPEWFVGPLLSELVAHEVGHTLGLRHNFKASSIYSLEEINGEKVKGKKPYAGSVMDYIPTNMSMKDGKLIGDHTMLGIGPYDYWAIEYGYTFDKDLKPILNRVAEPELQYGTDEDTSGPDPLARRYDFSKNPLDYARSQMQLAEYHRGRILDKFVKDGDSWSKARRGYELTLSLQMRSVSMMANWLGGSFVHRDRKGDKDGRIPIEVVPANMQREALDFVIQKTFLDESFALTPDLLSRMTVDKWLDGDGFVRAMRDEPAWPVHDRIMGLQAATLTMVMNPTTLRRIYDNEFRTPDDKDALTLPEVLEKMTGAIWTELSKKPEKKHSARQPMISSLRRNLQQEYVDRLITLSFPDDNVGTAQKTISNLATMELRDLRNKIAECLKVAAAQVDPYSRSHLEKLDDQIAKSLEAQYIYNANDLRPAVPTRVFFQSPDAETSKDDVRE